VTRSGTPGSPATWSASANTARPTFLNTYLIYLRFEMMRGRFTRERYAEELERVKALLRAGKEPSFRRIPARLGNTGLSGS